MQFLARYTFPYLASLPGRNQANYYDAGKRKRNDQL